MINSSHPDFSDPSFAQDGARVNSKSTRHNRFVLFGVLGLAVVTLTIGLSVGLTRNKANNANTDSARTGSSTMFTGSTTTGTTPTATPIGSTSTSAASTTTFTSSNDASSKTKGYMTSTGSLNVSLQLFNPNITIPYSDNDELKADLTDRKSVV